MRLTIGYADNKRKYEARRARDWQQGRAARATNMHRRWERHAKSPRFSRCINHNVISIRVTNGNTSSKIHYGSCIGPPRLLFGTFIRTSPREPHCMSNDKAVSTGVWSDLCRASTLMGICSGIEQCFQQQDIVFLATRPLLHNNRPKRNGAKSRRPSFGAAQACWASVQVRGSTMRTIPS